MVDTLIAAAALAAATSSQADALESAAGTAVVPENPEAVRTAVPVERRRLARVTTTSTADFESLRPLIERAKLDASLSETRSLLEQAEGQIRRGNHEQAMLTLDGATLEIERMRGEIGGSTNFVDTFIELERRESSLREKLGEPAILPLRPVENKMDAVEPGEAEPAGEDAGEKSPGKPVPPQLPVG